MKTVDSDKNLKQYVKVESQKIEIKEKRPAYGIISIPIDQDMIMAPSVNEGIISSSILNLNSNKLVEPAFIQFQSIKNGSKSMLEDQAEIKEFFDFKNYSQKIDKRQNDDQEMS